ncbi:hypothetical protein B0H14DRAFT_2572512 [Mycena olivaceomarginata]|nr:hypothetical protein B0H14DRAFT_2572512 [Mycena olivaceomarginata]
MDGGRSHWRAGWWAAKVGQRGLPEGPQCEGETAYALRQAKNQTQLADEFTEEWKALAELISQGRAGREVDGAEESDDEAEEGASDEEDEPIPTLPARRLKSTYVDEVLIFSSIFCARCAARRQALFDVVLQTCTILMNITYRYARYDQRRPNVLLTANSTSVRGERCLASWEVDKVAVPHEFFDGSNKNGYLPNWKSVVQWMSTNPHIPLSDTTFHFSEAADILLVVGLTLRECKAYSDADPDDPLAAIPFDHEDLEVVKAAVMSMLIAIRPKKTVKWGVAPAVHRPIYSTWKKVCLEVGLGEDDVNTFGGNWKTFVEAYAAADYMIKTWADDLDATGSLPADHQTDWQAAMTRVWQPIQLVITAASDSGSVDAILEEDWCRCGRGGLVCFVLGMKWWRTHLTRSPNVDSLNGWLDILSEMTGAFTIIAGAESLVPEAAVPTKELYLSMYRIGQVTKTGHST